MTTNPTAPPRRSRGPAALVFATTLCAAAFALPAAAQSPKPWVPAGDATLQEVTTARMKFQRQPGDSVGGENYQAFDIVGRVARRMLQQLGNRHFDRAGELEADLDSLGLDTEVAVDASMPSVVVVLVRNPFKLSSGAVAFLYWQVGDDLRIQGVGCPPCRDLRMRTWYTSRQEAPYELCMLYEAKGAEPRPGMKLLRMSPDGRFWNLVQYEGNEPDFGPHAQLAFVDANLDGRPEILSYHPVDRDSFFQVRPGLPPIVNEFLYTERPEGFVLHDARTLPGPLQALRFFAAAMSAKQYDQAKTWLLHPETIASATENGWSDLHGREAWVVEYGEEGQAWPEWVEVRTNDKPEPRRWIFRFYIDDAGRWVIRDWKRVGEAPGQRLPPGGFPADSTRGRR